MLDDAADAAVDAFVKGSALGSILGFFGGLIWGRGTGWSYAADVVLAAAFMGLTSGSIGAIIVFTARI